MKFLDTGCNSTAINSEGLSLVLQMWEHLSGCESVSVLRLEGGIPQTLDGLECELLKSKYGGSQQFFVR